jgi:hypothetical protein
MQWYYAKGGSQLGPVGLEELKARVAAGEVGPADLVWTEGMTDWIPAGQAPELRGSAPAAPIAGPSPYQTPSASDYGGTLAPTEKLPNYLWQSIVVALFCCQPLGIPAIVFAAKVDERILRGDIAGARDASRKAKMWCLWSLAAWLVFILCYGALIFYMVSTGKMQ